MKRTAMIVAIGVISLVSVIGLAGAPAPVAADNSPEWNLPKNWEPLSKTCHDVTGDGLVDLPNDILGVIQRFDARWGDDNYALVFDVDGGAVIDLPNDILSVILAFHPTGPNPDCSEIDTQVIRSAVALLPYQDCQDAAADGYESTGVYVPDMGIHISKLANLKTTFDPNDWDDLANPFGLVCSVDPVTGGVGKLIGPWYIIPVESTGTLYGQSGPFQPDTVPPEGFATGVDYIPYNQNDPGAQAAWHQHLNLCVGTGFLNEQGPNGTHQSCKGMGGFLNVPLYGWMLHLYNFVPNTELASQQGGGADARFMRWNRNPDFPICEYDPTPCGGGAGVAGSQEQPTGTAFCSLNLLDIDERLKDVNAQTLAD